MLFPKFIGDGFAMGGVVGSIPKAGEEGLVHSEIPGKSRISFDCGGCFNGRLQEGKTMLYSAQPGDEIYRSSGSR